MATMHGVLQHGDKIGSGLRRESRVRESVASRQASVGTNRIIRLMYE